MQDEVVGIMEQVTARAKRAGKPLTPASLFAFFVDACRANLHMVLAMSPVGGAFRERLRKFPSLVNCTTIDWFSVWPSDALKSVASKCVWLRRALTGVACGVWAIHSTLWVGSWLTMEGPKPRMLPTHHVLVVIAFAHRFLHDVEMTDDATRSAVEDMCMEFHVNVRALAVEFKAELGRHYYTTPTSYLELIQTYKELLGSKRKQVRAAGAGLMGWR